MDVGPAFETSVGHVQRTSSAVGRSAWLLSPLEVQCYHVELTC